MEVPLNLAVEIVTSESVVCIHGVWSSISHKNYICSYSPEHLVQEDVVVVTFNYRLSALGFLYLPETGIYGNAALKDQVSALFWEDEKKQKINFSLCFLRSLASGA